MSVSTDWKNRLTYTDNGIYVVYDNADEEPIGVEKLLPCITDVKEIKNTNTQIVIVYFSDGTSEKAVLSPEDTYSLEQGISICLEKRLISNYIPNQGGSVYNKLIKHAMRVYKNNRVAEEKKREEEIERAEKAERKNKKLLAKKARRKRLAKEREISIIVEAAKRVIADLNKPSYEELRF